MITKKTSFTLSKSSLVRASVAVVALGTFVLPATTFADTLYRELNIGMSGSDVSSVQTFLASDSSLYPQGLVTGYFGSLTKAAVARFQSRNGISPVGRIGPATLPVINAQMNTGVYTGTDRRAPVIGSVSVGVSSSVANISWNKDKDAAALVYYSAYPITLTEASANSSVTISGTPVTANLNVQTMHNASIIGLQPNTTYNYVVYVKDASGNESVTSVKTFRTTN